MGLNRVVITGCGAVSPFGLGVPALLAAVWQGRSGVCYKPEWEAITGLHSYLAAPVPDFDARPLLPRAVRRTMGRMAIFSTLAAREAIAAAAIPPELLSSGEVGVAIGSTTGSPSAYEEFYRQYLPASNIEQVKSGVFFKIMGHSCAANVCLALDIHGEQWAPASACTSAAQAIGLGYLLVRTGRQRFMLCGGADEVHATVTMVFDVVKAASHRHQSPSSTPRPFDRLRDGVVCGEGSGILVLESLDSARARGATILAEVIGFGHVNDSKHLANPHESSMARAMQTAMAEARIEPDAIDYANAHATGTLLGDVAEAQAIAMAVGPAVPVSSFKGHLGHTLGAAGALEMVILLEMLARQEVVPTLNLTDPDPECRVINLIQDIARRPLQTVIKNNFALGGTNVALVVGRWRHDQ